MRVELSNGLILKSNSTEYQLCRLSKNKKTGEVQDNAFKFYSSFEGMVKAVSEQALKESDATTLKECAEILRATKQEITEALRNG